MPKSSMPKKEDKDIKQAFSEAFGGIMGGLGEIIQRLGELAEKGEEIKKGGEFKVDSNVKSREMKGVYGFSIKTGLGGKEPKVEPFGNIRQDKATGRAVVEEVREPMVDVFEEEDHVLVVAEMPGVDREDLQLSLKDDILTLSAERGEKKYRKEILLPTVCDGEGMDVAGKNGILEIKCRLKASE